MDSLMVSHCHWKSGKRFNMGRLHRKFWLADVNMHFQVHILLSELTISLVTCVSTIESRSFAYIHTYL